MTWQVSLHDDFEAEFDALDEAVQDELLAHAKLLEHFGPQLGRPRVDTLNGSRYANMKELRFDADNGGAWPLLLTQSDRLCCSSLVTSREAVKRFYRQLITKADERFEAHLARLKKKTGK